MGIRRKLQAETAGLEKTPTGIAGLDEIMAGGLPRGRSTLVCGGAGCGKTLLALEFLVRGATTYDEPGVLFTFEETEDEIRRNVASLGFDLAEMARRDLLRVEHVRIERNEVEAAGDFDLEGLFVRLAHSIDAVGAKRVVLDTVEVLFAGLPDEGTLRSELRRLFRWLKDRGVTAVVTAERGSGSLTRHGLEEYVADCVVMLDHRVTDQMSTRRLRIVKYRGSIHGTNEYPFLIDEHGFSVLPITSMGLHHEATNERVPTGIPALDAMLGGEGYFRGSSVLVSGTAGTGKSSIAAQFADAACARGERCLYLAFEESPSQIVRNMRSIGIDLAQWERKGLLRLHAARPTTHGLEMHLVSMHKLIRTFDPRIVIVDPITNLTAVGNVDQIKAMVTRLIDHLKSRQITGLFTSLTGGEGTAEATSVGVSSLMDTWLLLRNLESEGERNRGLYVLKSRGMAHSNQIREFVLTNAGAELVDVCVRDGTVLVGSARAARAQRDAVEAAARAHALDRKRHGLEQRRRVIEGQIAALRAEITNADDEFARESEQERSNDAAVASAQSLLTSLRTGPATSHAPAPRRRRRAG